MYAPFRQFCERLLRIPSDPEPPPGDEATTRIFRAAVNYYRYLLCLWAIRTAAHVVPSLVFVIVLGIISLQQRFHWGVLFVGLAGLVIILHILVAIFSLAVVRLNFEKRWYIVTDRSLRVREGVIGIREMTVNFANIQNISISQGPLQRLLRISDLRVDTAGGGGGASTGRGHNISQNLHTAWFRGIENADEVRALIQDRLRHLKDSGLGDHEELISRPAATSSADFLAALRAVHAEASSLHAALAKAPLRSA